MFETSVKRVQHNDSVITSAGNKRHSLSERELAGLVSTREPRSRPLYHFQRFYLPHSHPEAAPGLYDLQGLLASCTPSTIVPKVRGPNRNDALTLHEDSHALSQCLINVPPTRACGCTPRHSLLG